MEVLSGQLMKQEKKLKKIVEINVPYHFDVAPSVFSVEKMIIEEDVKPENEKPYNENNK